MSLQWLSHLFLHPKEVVLFFFPLQADAIKYEKQWVQEEKPLFGMVSQTIPVEEKVSIAARVNGLLAITSQRLLYLSSQVEQTQIPEMVWEIYLHDIVEVDVKGAWSPELHISYEHNEEILHRTFYGNASPKVEKRLLEIMQTRKWIREHPQRMKGKLIECTHCKKWIDWRDQFCPRCGRAQTKK